MVTQMEQSTHFILTLIRLGIETMAATNENCLFLLNLPMSQWREVMALADRQGVAAVTFDGVQRLYETHKYEIKAAQEKPQEWMRWVFECTGMMTQYEQKNLQQRKIIGKLAEIWRESGIKMMVFKGQSNGSNPLHRALGDIDCYLFDDADLGDSIMAVQGAEVTNNWYRHSKISFRGETIENHRVFCHTRGSKAKKRMEKELTAMLKPSDMMSLEGCGGALAPTAQFNAHFLIYHALHHFTSEGLRMKQILDWALFLYAHQDNVNWAMFNDFCKRYKLDRFAAIMNYIASHSLGVECHTVCKHPTPF